MTKISAERIAAIEARLAAEHDVFVRNQQSQAGKRGNQQVKIVFGRYTAVRAIQERGALNGAIRDAIALAIRTDAPIFAADDVIEESAIEFEGEEVNEEEIVSDFKKFLDNVSDEEIVAAMRSLARVDGQSQANGECEPARSEIEVEVAPRGSQRIFAHCAFFYRAGETRRRSEDLEGLAFSGFL
jgi:hypothetical protein